jgi:hypothetical protein
VGGEGGTVAGENRVVFESCEENAPSIEVPTMEPSYISTVRVGKQCVDGASFDPTVPGLRVKVRTSAGVFSCGTLADAADAGCTEGGTMFWERRCDTLGAPIAARAVVVVREAPCTPVGAEHCAAVGPPKVRFLSRSGRQRKAAAPSYSFGSVVLTEVEALGRPVAVANVLLGQAASSTSQCHERPTYVPLGQHGTQFPSMAGSRVFDTGSEHACLEACQADDDCLAVSYVETGEQTKCVVSPSPLLSNKVVWTNLVKLEGSAGGNSSTDRAVHFTKSIPLRRLAQMSNHVHDGSMLDQVCVEDISVSGTAIVFPSHV